MKIILLALLVFSTTQTFAKMSCSTVAVDPHERNNARIIEKHVRWCNTDKPFSVTPRIGAGFEPNAYTAKYIICCDIKKKKIEHSKKIN